MTIIEYLCSYLRKYPELSGERIDIDCLGSTADTYSLDSVPGESVVRRFLDGSSVRRCLFVLSSRCYYGSDIAQQAENLAFFERLEGWIDAQRQLLALPELGAKRCASSLTVTASAYPFIVDEDTGLARYQMQFELIYIQEV